MEFSQCKEELFLITNILNSIGKEMSIYLKINSYKFDYRLFNNRIYKSSSHQWIRDYDGNMLPSGVFFYSNPHLYDGHPEKIFILDSPEKYEELVQKFPYRFDDGAELQGLFGPEGSLHVSATYPKVGREIYSRVKAPNGRSYWVSKEPIDPYKNIHFDFMSHDATPMSNSSAHRRRARERTGIPQFGSLNDEATVRQIHHALQALGAKSVTSVPSSFSRLRLFTQLTDKFHDLTGGAGDISRDPEVFDRRGNIVSEHVLKSLHKSSLFNSIHGKISD